MFGPKLPIHARDRIYRKRISLSGLLGCAITAVALFTVEVEERPYRPRVGFYRPVMIQVTEIDEMSDPEDAVAGGHPVESALEAVNIDPELTEAEPLVPEETTEGDAEVENELIEEPREGPAEGEGKAERDRRIHLVTSEEIIIERFLKPSYPGDAKLLGNEGTVLIRAHVGTDGAVMAVNAENIDRLLPSCVEAARSATLEWRFRPLERGGQPVEFWVDIPYRFRLGRVTPGI